MVIRSLPGECEMHDRKYGWISLIAGTFITAVLGASYAYSAYRPVLESLWQSSFLASLPFSVFIATFSFSSLVGGKLYSLKGIKTSATMSVAFVVLGLALSSLIEYIPDPLYLVFTYGILTGFGNGLGYIPVVTMARRWFPDRPGFATGVVIFGYGGSAVVFAPLKTSIITLHGISVTFFVVAIVSLVVGLVACFLIKDPDPQLTRLYAARAPARAVIPKQEIPPSSAVKTPDFWAIWISFMLTASPGLMLIGHMMSFVKSNGFDESIGALAISLFSVFNAIGRPPAGWISDRLGKYGRPMTMMIFFMAQSILFISLAWLEASVPVLLSIISIGGFFYGSALALYPAITGDFFGLKHLSVNYSLVFTGWGIAGLLAPSLGGFLVDLLGGYEVPLVLMSAMSLAGTIMCAYLKERLSLYLE